MRRGREYEGKLGLNRVYFSWKNGNPLVSYFYRRDTLEDENQAQIPSEEAPPVDQQAVVASDQPPPPEEPIILSRLYPETQKDLDTLFPDPQMKQLLKEVHRTQQSNQRFLKRLNLSKIQTEEEEPAAESK